MLRKAAPSSAESIDTRESDPDSSSSATIASAFLKVLIHGCQACVWIPRDSRVRRRAARSLSKGKHSSLYAHVQVERWAVQTSGLAIKHTPKHAGNGKVDVLSYLSCFPQRSKVTRRKLTPPETRRAVESPLVQPPFEKLLEGMKMIVAPRRGRRLRNHAMNLVANFNQDSRKKLVRRAAGDLITFAQRTAIIGGVTLKLDWVTDLDAYRLNVGAFPECHTVKHPPQSRVGRCWVGDEGG